MTLRQIIYNALKSRDKSVRNQNEELYFQYMENPQFFPNLIELVLNETEIFPECCVLVRKYLEKLINSNQEEQMRQIANQNVLAQLLQKLIQITDENIGSFLCKAIGAYQALLLIVNNQNENTNAFICLQEFINNVVKQQASQQYVYLIYIFHKIVDQNISETLCYAQIILEVTLFLLQNVDIKYYKKLYEIIVYLFTTVMFKDTSESLIILQKQNEINQILTNKFLSLLDQNIDVQILMGICQQLVDFQIITQTEIDINQSSFYLISKLMSVQQLEYQMMGVQYLETQLQQLANYPQNMLENTQLLQQICQLIQTQIIPIFATYMDQEYINSVLQATCIDTIETSSSPFCNIIYSVAHIAISNKVLMQQAFQGFLQQNKNLQTDQTFISVLFTLHALVEQMTTEECVVILNQFDMINSQNPIVLFKLLHFYLKMIELHERTEYRFKFQQYLIEQVIPKLMDTQQVNNLLILKLIILEIIVQIVKFDKEEFITMYNQYLSQLIYQYINSQNLQIKAKIIKLVSLFVSCNLPQAQYIDIIKENISIMMQLIKQIQLSCYYLHADEQSYFQQMIFLVREIFQSKTYMDLIIKQNVINIPELLQIIIDILKRDDKSFDESIIRDLLQLIYNGLYYCKDYIPSMVDSMLQLIQYLMNKFKLQKDNIFSDAISSISSYTIEIKKNTMYIMKSIVSIMQDKFIPYIPIVLEILQQNQNEYIDKGIIAQIIGQLLYLTVQFNQTEYTQILYQQYFFQPQQCFLTSNFRNYISAIIMVLTSLINAAEKQLFPQEQIQEWFMKMQEIIIQNIKNVYQFLDIEQEQTASLIQCLNQYNSYLEIIGELFEFIASNQLIEQMLTNIQIHLSNLNNTLSIYLLQQQIYYSMLQVSICDNKQTKIDISNTFMMMLTESLSKQHLNIITMKLLTLLLENYKTICLPLIQQNIQPLQQQFIQVIGHKTQINIQDSQFWYYSYFVLSYLIFLYPDNLQMFKQLIECMMKHILFIEDLQQKIFTKLQAFLSVQQQSGQQPDQNSRELFENIIILLVNLFFIEDVQSQIDDQAKQWTYSLINSNVTMIQNKQQFLLNQTKAKLQQLSQTM